MRRNRQTDVGHPQSFIGVVDGAKRGENSNWQEKGDSGGRGRRGRGEKRRGEERAWDCAGICRQAGSKAARQAEPASTKEMGQSLKEMAIPTAAPPP